MTGVSILLICAVLLTNVCMLVFFFLERNRNSVNVSPPPQLQKEKDQVSETEEKEKPDTEIVGKSTFNIDDFEVKFNRVEERLATLSKMLDRLEGDVRLKDVEFTNPEDRPTAEDIANDEVESEKFIPRKFSRMNPETEANAFEDVRIEDFDPDMVSAPSASGVSMEDIESSVDTAMNPAAPAEEKAKAGKILNGLVGTDLMDRLTSVEDIYKGVMSCLRESYRMDIGVGTSHKTRNSSSGKARKHIVPANIEDFNPADLLKK